ncbi:hypothetical protein H6P81_005454 [Aristolochia fimbriata]|uniref:Uncharacterized protein n=1 Tax=Aristolochia fimbriata TaxID=158543 RepID=A0AAV7EUH4_ARIFI|nr:hypothetical protein H6P81_005454 [Aristolochia fimbriata]
MKTEEIAPSMELGSKSRRRTKQKYIKNTEEKKHQNLSMFHVLGNKAVQGLSEGDELTEIANFLSQQRPVVSVLKRLLALRCTVLHRPQFGFDVVSVSSVGLGSPLQSRDCSVVGVEAGVELLLGQVFARHRIQLLDEIGRSRSVLQSQTGGDLQKATELGGVALWNGLEGCDAEVDLDVGVGPDGSLADFVDVGDAMGVCNLRCLDGEED